MYYFKNPLRDMLLKLTRPPTCWVIKFFVTFIITILFGPYFGVGVWVLLQSIHIIALSRLDWLGKEYGEVYLVVDVVFVFLAVNLSTIIHMLLVGA